MTGAPKGQLGIARSVLERKEQRLAAELRGLIAERDGARATLERLESYIAEYGAAERAGTAGGRSSVVIMNERGFVGRLHHALGEQRRQFDRLAARVTDRTALWNRARADLTALDRVIERRRDEARQHGERRDQRERDAAPGRPRGAGAPLTITGMHPEHDT